jgi:hypothetical protein
MPPLHLVENILPKLVFHSRVIVIIFKLFYVIFVRGFKINRQLGLYSQHLIFIVTYEQAQ